MPAITGIGIASAAGAGTVQACAAMRAGLSRVVETKLYAVVALDPKGEPEPLRAAAARTVSVGATGADRLHPLALQALGEAGLKREDLARSSIHLALSGRSRPGTSGLDESFATELCRRGGLAGFASVTVSRAGHSGAVEAMGSALESLHRNPEGYAFV